MTPPQRDFGFLIFDIGLPASRLPAQSTIHNPQSKIVVGVG